MIYFIGICVHRIEGIAKSPKLRDQDQTTVARLIDYIKNDGQTVENMYKSEIVRKLRDERKKWDDMMREGRNLERRG